MIEGFCDFLPEEQLLEARSFPASVGPAAAAARGTGADMQQRAQQLQHQARDFLGSARMAADAPGACRKESGQETSKGIGMEKSRC